MVHNLMEGQLDAWSAIAHDAEAAKAAVPIFHKVVDMKSNLGLQVVLDWRKQPVIERKQVWRIAPFIDFVTKIDCLCIDDQGEYLIIDWKSTLGNGWKTMVIHETLSFTPQAHGFQSISYLIPRPARLLKNLGVDGLTWPKKMLYIVGPARGPVQVFPYSWNEGDYANFKEALKLVSQAVAGGRFPKVFDKHCHDCEYKGPCLTPLGWQTAYQRRRKEGDRSAPIELSE